MIQLIQICNEKFHYFEFVKPIEDVFQKNEIEFNTIHYKNLTDDIIQKADKIIITGTSLKDNEFLKDIDSFKWIKEFKKPILGICGGMHILGLVHNGELKKQQEIGLTEIFFIEEFLGLNNKIEVYELHNFYVISKSFDITAESEKCPQAIKHKKNPFYGVLFHPEVRNKEFLVNFANLPDT
jgi:GMP synthase (glutamine-hydrolysing)